METDPNARPAVSIIIPAYDAAATIGEALESVFAQTFKDFEVILINDGSPDTDLLEKVIGPYRERITYLKQSNQGPSAARNTGIRCARALFLAFLDSDDVWYPDYLAVQMKFVREHPGLDAVYANLLYHGDTPYANRSVMEVFPPKTPVTFESFLSHDFPIFFTGTVIRTQAAIDAGLFDERFIRAEDVDLFLRLAHQSKKIACHSPVLGRRLVRADSLSFQGSKVGEAEEQVFRKLLDKLDLTPEQRRLLLKRIAKPKARQAVEQGKQSLMAGDFAAAIQSLESAYSVQPGFKLRWVLWGLRVAPGSVRFAVRLWNKSLSRGKPPAL